MSDWYDEATSRTTLEPPVSVEAQLRWERDKLNAELSGLRDELRVAEGDAAEWRRRYDELVATRVPMERVEFTESQGDCFECCHLGVVHSVDGPPFCGHPSLGGADDMSLRCIVQRGSDGLLRCVNGKCPLIAKLWREVAR